MLSTTPKIANEGYNAHINVGLVLMRVNELDNDIFALSPPGELHLRLRGCGVRFEIHTWIGRIIGPEPLHNLHEFIWRHRIILFESLHIWWLVHHPNKATADRFGAPRPWTAQVEVGQREVLRTLQHQGELASTVRAVEGLDYRYQCVLYIELCLAFEGAAIVGVNFEFLVQQHGPLRHRRWVWWGGCRSHQPP
jgi:hypothetical protein